MKIPISFDDVPYFGNEYRGDMIVTMGVLYYFPHTRVGAARVSREIQGEEKMELVGAVGALVPLLGLAPWAFEIVDKSVKFGRFIKRNAAPSINNPRIRKLHLWSGNDSSESLQEKLDRYIDERKVEPLAFEDDSVPKPMRFSATEMENMRLGLKFRFDAKYDSHDFRINPIRRSLFKRVLREAGFLKQQNT